jgi:hypothetical protein
MTKRYLPIIFFLIISCASGCAVFGRGKDFRAFDENALKQVIPGKTTAPEVTKLFGPPSQVVRLSNGNAYVYERSVNKATGLWLVILAFGNFDTQYDRIVFFITRDDIVSHYGSSFKTEKASYAMPF